MYVASDPLAKMVADVCSSAVFFFVFLNEKEKRYMKSWVLKLPLTDWYQIEEYDYEFSFWMSLNFNMFIEKWILSTYNILNYNLNVDLLI